jgi:glucose-1-phosphate adenylyltransferase
MQDVLAIILGGGRGNRLFPLTLMRSKPAVPIGGKYRLIDIPLSSCLHAGLRRIFVLTQFNSASLNRHISQTYRMDLFSGGFVDILAAEQTPDNPNWFQGTADAVRQAARHFSGYQADYYLILAGDHLYRMDYGELVDAHVDRQADITIAAQPVAPEPATEMGIFRFGRDGQIEGFEEKPSAERLSNIDRSIPAGALFAGYAPDKPFIASMGIYVFSRDVLLEILAQNTAQDFGREIIPAALGTHRVNAFLYQDYWADVGTIESFYDANMLLTRDHPPFRFYDPRKPIFTRPRFLAASRFIDARIDHSMVAEGCYVNRCTIGESIVGIRTRIDERAQVTRSVLLGADFYDADETRAAGDPSVPMGIGQDAVLDRVIVDKNARIGRGVRLVNERGVDHEDGQGWAIRNGIIVVPKGAVIPDGTVV